MDYYRVSTVTWRCILGVVPAYLSELFVPTSACPSRRSLRSASRGDYLLKTFLLSGSGLGALLSSYLERALYKLYICIILTKCLFIL